MNRTRQTECFAVATGGRSSADFRVATSFIHPGRGEVRCPASDVVAAWLGRAGAEVVQEPFGSLVPQAPADRRAEAACATTYLEPDGLAVGIAVASAGHWQDAEAAVHLWTRAMRTRRVLLVPADERCSGLARRPAAPSGSGQDCRPAAEEPPLGVPRQCPHHLAARRLTADFASRGDTVVMVGPSGAPQLPAAAGGFGTAVTAIPTAEHAHRFQPADPDRLSFVLRPCTPVEPAAEILAVLRTRFPALRGQHPDQWCYAESDFRAASASVADASDLLLTVGHGPFPAPGDRVPPERHRHVHELADLRPGDLTRAATLGLVERGPDAAHLTRQILTALSGLGPLAVAHRQHRTRRYDIRHGLPTAGPLRR